MSSAVHKTKMTLSSSKYEHKCGIFRTQGHMNLIEAPLNYYLVDAIALLVPSERESDPDRAGRRLRFCKNWAQEGSARRERSPQSTSRH